MAVRVTHFLVVGDQARARAFYERVFGALVVRERDPVILELFDATLILNDGGPPTPDKPGVVLEPPADPSRVSALINLRVDDLAAVHREWATRGAEWLTEPVDRGPELRAYLRDPDGHLIEVGQAT